MSGNWLISYYVLWGVALTQTVLIIILFRQLGIVYLRLGPRPAATILSGPEIGSQVPSFELSLSDGSILKLGASMEKSLLMVFTVPNCPTCQVLLPGVAKLRRVEKKHLEVILITNAEQVEKGWNNGVPLVQSPTLFDDLKIRNTPYGVIVSTEGIVRAKGIINHIEHLESLVNALETGYATLAEKLEEEKRIHESEVRELRT